MTGLALGVSSALSFRDEVRAWQASAELRAVREAERLQGEIGAAEALARELKDASHRHDIALERQAGELREHRLSAPPPKVWGSPVPDSGVRVSGRVQTSADWDDGDGRATQVRRSEPPPLPAYGRPGYMSR